MSNDPTRTAAAVLTTWHRTFRDHLSKGPGAGLFKERLAHWAGRPQTEAATPEDADKRERKIAARRTRCENSVGGEFGLYTTELISRWTAPKELSEFRVYLQKMFEEPRTTERLIEDLDLAGLIGWSRGRRGSPGSVEALPAAVEVIADFHAHLVRGGLTPLVVNRVVRIKGAWQDQMDTYLAAGGENRLAESVDRFLARTARDNPGWCKEERPRMIRAGRRRLRENIVTLVVAMGLHQACKTGIDVDGLGDPDLIPTSAKTIARTLDVLAAVGLAEESGRVARLTDAGRDLYDGYVAAAGKATADMVGEAPA